MSASVDRLDHDVSTSPRPPARDDLHLRKWAVAALLLVSAVAVVVSLVHVVDSDEGSILLAGKSIAHGSVLYRDFNFPYPPVSPHAYAIWMRIFGTSWVSGRLFSALVMIAIMWVLYVGVLRATKRRSLAIAAVLMYGFAAQTLIFLTVVKSHALAILFLLSAYILIAYGRASPRWRYGFAGILFALCVSTRPYLVAIAPLLVLETYRSTSEGRRRAIGWFLAGGLLGAMVNLPFLLRAPSVFFYNAVRAQLSRNAGAVGGLAPKARVIVELFDVTRHGNSQLGPPAAAQFWTLLGANVAYVFWCLQRGRRVAGCVWIAALIGVVSILPNPPYSQYWSITIPFLIFGAAILFGDLLDRAPDPDAGRRIGAGVLIVALAFMTFGQNDIHRFLASRMGGSQAPAFDLDAVRAVSRVIDAQTKPGERVMSFWPGYLVESHAVPVPRMENQTAWAPFQTLNVARGDYERFKLAPPDYIESLIRSHATRLIVVQRDFTWLYAPLDPTYFDATIERAGYVPLVHIGTATIYRCTCSPAS